MQHVVFISVAPIYYGTGYMVNFYTSPKTFEQTHNPNYKQK